ncbi:MAG: histidine phosphatase family protein [Dokdonella sp.]
MRTLTSSTATVAAFGLVMMVVTSFTIAAEAPAAFARNIVLVRHGNYTSDPKADPKLGPGLSPLGVAQAHMVGAQLAGIVQHFDSLYVSPLQRARDTAAIIAGNFPGRSFKVLDDLEECTPPTRRSEITKDDKPEALAACKEQLDRLFDMHFKPALGAERAEMYVCHGNVIRYLTTRALGVDSQAWLEMSVHHASITRIRVEADGHFKVISVGDSGFMPANMLTGATGDPDRSLAIPELPVQTTD